MFGEQKEPFNHFDCVQHVTHVSFVILFDDDCLRITITNESRIDQHSTTTKKTRIKNWSNMKLISFKFDFACISNCIFFFDLSIFPCRTNSSVCCPNYWEINSRLDGSSMAIKIVPEKKKPKIHYEPIGRRWWCKVRKRPKAKRKRDKKSNLRI